MTVEVGEAVNVTVLVGSVIVEVAFGADVFRTGVSGDVYIPANQSLTATTSPRKAKPSARRLQIGTCFRRSRF